MADNEQNQFGLNQRDMKTLLDILHKYSDVRDVFIFGSRAKGNFKHGSDIDLAIMNPGVSDAIIVALKRDFADSSLPYFVDVVNDHSLQHNDLKNHIDRVGVPFYRRGH